MEKAGCKVLFVDDSDDERVLFHVAFRVANARHLKLINTLASGDEAILYLAGEGKYGDRSSYPVPDLLILDLKMAGSNGFDVLEWIRKNNLRFLIVVHSTSSEHADAERALRLGANDYVIKAANLLETITWLKNLDNSWARWSAGLGWHRHWGKD